MRGRRGGGPTAGARHIRWRAATRHVRLGQRGDHAPRRGRGGLGAALVHYTGSREHVAQTRRARPRPRPAVDAGGMRTATAAPVGRLGNRITPPSMPWIPPERRHGSTRSRWRSAARSGAVAVPTSGRSAHAHDVERRPRHDRDGLARRARSAIATLPSRPFAHSKASRTRRRGHREAGQGRSTALRPSYPELRSCTAARWTSSRRQPRPAGLGDVPASTSSSLAARRGRPSADRLLAATSEPWRTPLSASPPTRPPTAGRANGYDLDLGPLFSRRATPARPWRCRRAPGPPGPRRPSGAQAVETGATVVIDRTATSRERIGGRCGWGRHGRPRRGRGPAVLNARSWTPSAPSSSTSGAASASPSSGCVRARRRCCSIQKRMSSHVRPFRPGLAISGPPAVASQPGRGGVARPRPRRRGAAEYAAAVGGAPAGPLRRHPKTSRPTSARLRGGVLRARPPNRARCW